MREARAVTSSLVPRPRRPARERDVYVSSPLDPPWPKHNAPFPLPPLLPPKPKNLLPSSSSLPARGALFLPLLAARRQLRVAGRRLPRRLVPRADVGHVRLEGAVAAAVAHGDVFHANRLIVAVALAVHCDLEAE